MTRMSEPHAAKAPISSCNNVTSWGGSPVARAVHALRAVVYAVAPISVLTLGGLGGCVIPPSLEVELGDAAVNSPPAILSIASDQQLLREPGPVTFDRGTTAGNLSISLIDTDLEDTLYVSIFVDYNLPDKLPPRVQCMAPPNMNAKRTATCVLSSLCAIGDVGEQRSMTIMVFDRMPLVPGDPPFQQTPAGGLSTSRFYYLMCQSAPT